MHKTFGIPCTLADARSVDIFDAVMVASTSIGNPENASPDSKSVNNFNAVMVAGITNSATAQDVADMLSMDFGIEKSVLNDNQQHLCDNSVIVSLEVSFLELMATPKVTKRKNIRKKSQVLS